MEARSVANERTQITFGTDPFSILNIRNRLTGEDVCSEGKQGIIVRTPREISDPTFLTCEYSSVIDDQGFHFVLADEAKKYKADLRISVSENGIRWRTKVTSPKPIWLVEWKLTGLDLDEWIVPALGGQVLRSNMPIGTTVSYKYPFWWNAQFAIGRRGTGGMWVHTKDAEPKFKMLRIRRESDGFALTYGFEANAPLESKTLTAEWYLDCYKGSWRTPVDIHRRWIEQAFGLVPLQLNPHFPKWANNINFVLEIWGMAKDRPEPHHTFEDMIHRLKRWRRLHLPEQTLVYLPGYAEHGIDSRAPEYAPSRYLGGEKKFRELVDVAHGLGYRVMIHTNVLAMTFSHRLFRRFKQYQVVDHFGRTQGWALDLDGDWLAEPYFAYINPGVKAWGDLMEKVIGRLIKKYNIDAVFLDQTLLAFNVSKGPNFLLGMRNHIKRLQKAFPNVLFAGEGLHEHVLSALPVAQIHGIDSIAEVHGAEGKRRWRNVHPVSTYLFGKYTRFLAHLLTKHPSSSMFNLQEKSYARLGVIPALCLYNRTQPLDMPEISAMVARTKRLRFWTPEDGT